MRRNLDLIIILTLSVLVCGVLYLLYDSTKAEIKQVNAQYNEKHAAQSGVMVSEGYRLIKRLLAE